MKNYPNIAIVASFFRAMDGFLPTYNLSNNLDFLNFLPLESCTANDLLLIKKYKSRKNNRSWIMILGYYVVIVLTEHSIYSANGALLFIIVSSYHFGEQQWQNLNQTFPNGCWYYFSFYMVL
jgi:hypothetical protein